MLPLPSVQRELFCPVDVPAEFCMKLVKEFLADQSGGTAIEYGLLAGLLAIGLVVSLTQVKDGMFVMSNGVKNGLANN